MTTAFSPSSVIVIGPGRVGLSLWKALAGTPFKTNVLIDACLPPGPAHPDVNTCVLDGWIPSDEACILVLCVPDDAIVDVAARVANQFSSVAKDWVALHVSGARDASSLAPLARIGMATASWHPLQTFPLPDPTRFSGTPIVMEGHSAAVEIGRRLADALAGIPLEIPTPSKVAYHTLASICCGHIAAQITFCFNAMDDFPESMRSWLREGLRRLALSTLEGMTPPFERQMVTGPAARGDWDTVRIHQKWLEQTHPEWLPVYNGLTAFIRSEMEKKTPQG